MNNTKILPLDVNLIEQIGGNYSKFREWLYEELKLNASASDLAKTKITTLQIDTVEKSLVELNQAISDFNVTLDKINGQILRSKEVKL